MYRQHCKDNDMEYIDNKTYNKLMRSILKRIMDFIIYDNFIFTPPHKMGVFKKKARKVPPGSIHRIVKVDGKPVMKAMWNQDQHSYFFNIKWINSHLMFKNRKLYTFKIPYDRARELYYDLKATTSNPLKKLLIH